MKSIIIFSLVSILNQPFGFMNNQNFDIYKNFGFTANDIFNYEGKLTTKNQKKIYFENDYGYFVSYENKDNEIIGSILFEFKNNKWTINTCYEGSYIPLNDNDYYYINGEFLTVKEKLNQINTIDNFVGGVTYESIIDSSLYFKVSGTVNSHLNVYSASYLQEVRIKNVPNYENNLFNDHGCTPTTAAMYFSYLEDNGYDLILFKECKNMPLLYTDDSTKVDLFIAYLGGYFQTVSTGTKGYYIRTAYANYISKTNYPSYLAFETKNYNEYKNAIYNAAIPVHVDFYEHSTLGIGYKELHQSNGDISRFVIVNNAENGAMAVEYKNVDEIDKFYPIYYFK